MGRKRKSSYEVCTNCNTPKLLLILSILLPSLPTLTYLTIFLTITHLTTTMSQLIVPQMPTHGDHGAPQFNPAKPCELCHFFEDLNFQFTQSHVVDEEEVKEHTLWFVNCNTAELWEILPKFANMTTPYQKFVDAVYQLYPGSNVEQHWLIADMERLVVDSSRAGISLMKESHSPSRTELHLD